MDSLQSRTTLPEGERLGYYFRAFRKAARLDASEFRGVFDGYVVGPGWFRPAFRSMMAVGGLGGWQGKEFDATGNGGNLCLRGGRLRKVARMYVAGTVKSELDGQDTLALRYRAKSALGLLQDEIRRFDGNTVLGMTYVDLRPGRRLPMPFALVKRP